MPEREPAEFRPARESSAGTIVLILVVIAAIAGGAWYWTHRDSAPPPPSVSPAASTPQPDGPVAAPTTTAAPGPQNPVDALAEPDRALPALADSDGAVAKALTELLGRAQVASFVQLDGAVRRFVATVDNLPRSQAPSRMWPVMPAPERLRVTGTAGATAISPDNAMRYTAFVRLAGAVDPDAAAKVYARLYPLFQQAYEELGYPGRYFNDRLIAVIDHLLQAPEPEAMPRVVLTEVKGEVAASRPWVRYEFADPKLEALSSGQKLLVRVGPVNERQLKQALREFRSRIATGSVARK